jgi:hypothetical protein
MEIKVRIGDSEERIWRDGATTSWINEQIGARLDAGVPVCVIVTVNGSGVRNLTFAAGECGSSGGGFGAPRYSGEEQRIIDTWKRIGVQESPVNAGKLTAFMQQVS